jgi:hypothetical protein
MADGEETADSYCVSEWRLQGRNSGRGSHSHDDDVELFYVNEST